jgi:thiol-disulfide isomerase/thioredoxin
VGARTVAGPRTVCDVRNGALILLLVVVLTTAFGLYRRATDGRMRPHRSPESQSQSRRSDVPVPIPDGAPEVGLESAPSGQGVAAGGTEGSADRLTAAELEAALGERATLVQFSTAFCQPCRATRRTLTDVSTMVAGVAAVEVDAESHLDLVRRLGITRTPTVFVLDAEGRIVRRAVGAPRRADVIAALGELL